VAAIALAAPAGLSEPLRPASTRHQPSASVHRPPVEAPVLDPFRPPPADQPWRPGNRGIEYDTEPGQTVRASAAGTVTFAGSIGATRHVTVHHSLVLRTTYSFLRDVTVRRGQRVSQGQAIGTAGEAFHFGALFDDVYIDPAMLFRAIPVRRVRLVA
ncbi:MAG: M23 family metallopeptidase, partial [Acidimicrobiales bacterium]|nr:M23 family metallopeptidase [Acidimicrobiales bacterium]